VRKADSSKHQQLLGGDSDDEFEHSNYSDYSNINMPNSSVMGNMARGFMNMGSSMVNNMVNSFPATANQRMQQNQS